MRFSFYSSVALVGILATEETHAVSIQVPDDCPLDGEQAA